MNYVWRGGWVDKQTGEPMAVKPGPLAIPMIRPVMPEYNSPVTGKPITTRYERSEDLKRSDSVPYEESLSPTKGKFKNARFCKKHGFKLSDDYR
ncbi:hypothetical protein FJV76_14305 [Mesorhizobium sp. WSM4303]|uniref:hypothetical protein n=1 Tax=Mesorhizobium sp. WSM4303 TaxID=2589887 RepID=UPI00115CE5E7|nr:hypothetical protein [Mesorhizobium sp. WSM4303]TRD03806.1 hypothetical protein FJV76_14305 [Mesorhizobium sp. WSM4303]